MLLPHCRRASLSPFRRKDGHVGRPTNPEDSHVALSDNKILAMLGFSCTGDLGPWTLYTSDRHQIVYYPRMPALNPPSPKQLTQRASITAAAASWRALSNADRTAYETASRRASLKITGYNLWVYLKLTDRRDVVDTIARQTGVTLPG